MPPKEQPTTPSPKPASTPPAQAPPTSSGWMSPSFLKKFLLALAGIFLVLIIILALHPAKKSSLQTNSTQPAGINVSAKGFTPATIQVSAGTQITWTNTDKKVHQVAADPYPKDDSIPGFNSTVILNKGDTFSFRFSTAGTYTYHDERNPMKFRGTVVVR